ncbi:hypothetical protein NQD34_011486 [Periophthalmus magnuspinnatus]|nr:hypothetical protein NQD34_011486 [Periophthalmus magnuspinnatus]
MDRTWKDKHCVYKELLLWCLCNMKQEASYRQAGLGHSISRLGPAVLFVLVTFSFLHKPLHQLHQLVLCDVLTAESGLKFFTALVQGVRLPNKLDTLTTLPEEHTNPQCVSSVDNSLRSYLLAS